MQLIFPTSGHGRILGRPVGDLAVKRRHRLPAGEPVLLRLPHRRRAARLLRALFGIPRRRAAGARVAGVLDEVGLGAERRLQLRKFSKGMCSASASPRRCSTIPRSSSSTSRCRASIRSAAATSAQLILRLRDRGCTVFFSSHILSRRRSAVQPRRHRRAGPAGRRRPADRDAGVRVQGLGAGRGRRSSDGAAASAADAGPRAVVALGDGRYTIELPPDLRPSGCSRELTAPGAQARLAQPGARHPRGLLRPAGGEPSAAQRRGLELLSRARHRAVALRRVPRVGARPGALQPGRCSRCC